MRRRHQNQCLIREAWPATDPADAGRPCALQPTAVSSGMPHRIPHMRTLTPHGRVMRRRPGIGRSPSTALEAIRAFAGDDISVAIVEPEAQAMLLDFDRTAAHRSVVVDARS